VRRALAVALAFALVTPGTAAAQRVDPSFRPIVGGGSFNSAPVIEPGRYRDTILPDEYIYYAVDVQAGQKMRLTVQSDMSVEEASFLVSSVKVNFHSPSREFVDGLAEGSFRDAEDPPTVIDGHYASSEEDDKTWGDWPGPGLYYIGMVALYTGSADEPPRVEIPFHFELELVGTPEPTPTPEPTSTPSPTTTPSPTAEPAEEPREYGPTAMAAAGAGVAGLLMGVIGGIIRRRRRR
jgi:hypothetical protein